MLRFIGWRILWSLPLLFLVTFVVFLMLFLAPGDPARVVAGPDAGPEEIEQIRERLGLNDPVIVQYGRMLRTSLSGDLGTSLMSSQSVGGAIVNRLPVTASLTAGAVLVSLLVAIPLGVTAALRTGGRVDRAVILAASLGIATPSFFLGLLLLLVFSRQLGWMPATGYVPLSSSLEGWVRHLLLPSIALGTLGAAELARHVRAAMIDVLNKDYMRTAVGKGLPKKSVILKHAMKNALIPVVTVLGLQLRDLLGGAVVIEAVFNLPGIGALLLRSVFARDFPMIQGVMLFIVVVVILVNLLVDLSYGYLDPRVRKSTT